MSRISRTKVTNYRCCTVRHTLHHEPYTQVIIGNVWAINRITDMRWYLTGATRASWHRATSARQKNDRCSLKWFYTTTKKNQQHMNRNETRIIDTVVCWAVANRCHYYIKYNRIFGTRLVHRCYICSHLMLLSVCAMNFDDFVYFFFKVISLDVYL